MLQVNLEGGCRGDLDLLNAVAFRIGRLRPGENGKRAPYRNGFSRTADGHDVGPNSTMLVRDRIGAIQRPTIANLRRRQVRGKYQPSAPEANVRFSISLRVHPPIKVEVSASMKPVERVVPANHSPLIGDGFLTESVVRCPLGLIARTEI